MDPRELGGYVLLNPDASPPLTDVEGPLPRDMFPMPEDIPPIPPIPPPPLIPKYDSRAFFRVPWFPSIFASCGF